MDSKLYIVMVGLPARGKSTVAAKLKQNLAKDAIATRIFNNGDLRRRLIPRDTSHADFYDPRNQEGVAFREKLALMSIERARRFLSRHGRVAILDATNVSQRRRRAILERINNHPCLFIECINEDPQILEASITQKTTLPEFRHMQPEEAAQNFKLRIRYYESLYHPLTREPNYLKLDTLYNRILREEIRDTIPYYDRIRDFLVTDTVRNLFLIRHGQTDYNVENRIGGDSELTARGRAQAEALARHFSTRRIPIIFTSQKRRAIQTAEPIRDCQPRCRIVPLAEFNEIDSGICECMSYEEIRRQLPHVYEARKQDKYHYIYPGGEGYVSMKARIDRGIKKALYLSGPESHLMIVGHRAVNRMILSHFLYRREEDVPYIYIPQDKYYHIVATQDKKLFQLKKYAT